MGDTISSVVSLSPAFATEVHLKRDFIKDEVNKDKLRGYVPTKKAREAFQGILEGTHPASHKRVHLVTGSYGTGKSHFGLILANLVSKRFDDPAMNPLLEKLKDNDPGCYEYLFTVLSGNKPYLIVLPEPHWDSEGLNHSLLTSLSSALDRENIEYCPPSHFNSALTCVQNWQQNNKEAYDKLSNALLKRGKTVDMLVDGLQVYQEDIFTLFQEVHEEIAYGAVFNPQIYANPAIIYEETAKYLKSKDQYRGIFIFYDEFGSYLTYMARDPDSKGGQQLQEFAEFCKRSEENQCHLVVIAHQTLKDYARGYRTEEEWGKIYGRFIDSEYTLASAGDEPETEDMINSIIIQDTSTENWNIVNDHGDIDILADLVRNLGLYKTRDLSWIESCLVKGCYPLHPLTVFCLPWLSDRVGQRERTVFTCLSQSTEDSLRNYINRHSIIRTDGRLSLFTVDMLFDYFKEQIRNHQDYRHIALAAENALALCGESIIAQRIIKAIAVLMVVRHPLLPRNKKVIADTLHLSPNQNQEVAGILSELVKQRVLLHRLAADVYELPSKTGIVDAREAVDKAKNNALQRGGFNLVSFLNNGYKPQPIIAYEYAQKHFVRRQALCEFISASHLSNPIGFTERIKRWHRPNRGKYEGDVLILYLVADSMSDIESAQSYQKKEVCNHPQMAIAVPKYPITFTELALELEAISLLKQAGLVVEEGTIDKDDLNIIEQDAVKGIKEGLSEFIRSDNLIWYCNGNIITNLNKDDEDQYISSLLESVFGKTPLIRDDSTANPLVGADRDRKGRQDAMDRILGIQGAFQVLKTGGPAADRIIRACLRDTELLEKKSDKASVAEYEIRSIAPQNSELADIWQLMYDLVVVKGGKETPLTEIVIPLIKPPYGLSNQAVEIILAAFLRTRRDDSVVFSNVQNFKKSGNTEVLNLVHLNGEAITGMVYEPEDYAIVYYEIKPEEREYLEKIASILQLDADIISSQGIWDGVKNGLLNWFNTLPVITKSTRDYSNPYCVRLIETADSVGVQATAKELLTQNLPQAFELDSAQYSELLDRFQDVYDELNAHIKRIEALLLSKLGDIFNASGSTDSEIGESLKRWFNQTLSEPQRVHIFKGDEGSLIEIVRQEGPIIDRLLYKLPALFSIGPYTNWDSETAIDYFVLKVQLAKSNVEMWVPDVTSEPGDDIEKKAIIAERQIRNILKELNLPNNRIKDILEKLLKELPS